MSGNWDETDRLPPEALDADAILRTLLEHDVDFVVIGGLAVAAHGYARATKDVDVVPSPTNENRRRLYEALTALAAEPIEIGDFRPVELPVAFTPAGLDEGGNWALRTSAGRIDVMQWIPGYEEDYDTLRARALDVDLPGVGRIPFAGYGDLLTMKRAAGRPQDGRDIDELRAIREPGG